jgi:glycosyltransferase involved in cell wall biosynthesis
MTDNPGTSGRRPKIAVYALALDEEGHADRFLESCDKADCVVVADTGSSDRTVEILTQRGARVFPISVKPWRFDLARNAALALVPAGVDICVSLDLDEVLLPGWREALDESFAADVSRYRYDYVWKYADDGSPEIVYRHDKIHARNGCGSSLSMRVCGGLVRVRSSSRRPSCASVTFPIRPRAGDRICIC